MANWPFGKSQPKTSAMRLYDAINRRRDTRSEFNGSVVDDEVLTRLLSAAHAAPSVGMSQPWDFVLIRNPDTLAAFRDHVASERDVFAASLEGERAETFSRIKIEGIVESGLGIVVGYDPTRGGSNVLGRHAIADAGLYSTVCAIQNMWLAATAEGIGMGWVSFYREEFLRDLVGMPEHVRPVAWLCVGPVDDLPEVPDLERFGWRHRSPLATVLHDELYGRRTDDYVPTSVAAPSAVARREAQERLGALATPPGALGRLGDLGVWVAACQGEVPPRQIQNPRLVIFAGDHGVAGHGVSAFPPAITGAMVRTFLIGKAGVSALAKANGVAVRVLDIGVDEDFDDMPADVVAALQRHKVRRSSGALHLEDALSAEEVRAALEAGATVAREEIAAGADLLISGDMGIGNTTPAATLIAAALGLPASEVVGRGTGIDDQALIHKTAIIDQALARVGVRLDDPIQTLQALGSADLAASVGFMLTAAAEGVPVILDGLMAVACGLTADRIVPGAAAWFAAGHRSTEPAQSVALAKMGLEPLLDLGMRLGEGSGAAAAVPVVRNAVAVLRDVALLSELGVE